MKFVVLAIFLVLGAVYGQSVDEQHVAGLKQSQASEVVDLNRKSRQLIGTGTGYYPYSSGLTQGVAGYPYAYNTGIDSRIGSYPGVAAGYPYTGLGYNNGMYSAALYGGGSYNSGLYGSPLSGGYINPLVSGYNYNQIPYQQLANDPYNAISTRAFVPSTYYRRAF